MEQNYLTIIEKKKSHLCPYRNFHSNVQNSAQNFHTHSI